MRYVTAIFMSVLCDLSFSHSSSIAEDTFPSSLTGFFKPGMHFGINADQPETIEIYSDEKYQITTDARKMHFEELEKKYPKVAEEAARQRAGHQETLDRIKERKTEPLFAPTGELSVTANPNPKVTLYTILHVNESYLVATYGINNSRKLVIAMNSIARIQWAMEGLPIRATIKRPTGS
jgi:hypothetical protein